MGPASRWRLALALALAGLPQAVLSGDAIPCDAPGLSVQEAPPGIAALVCAEALGARRLLADCGLAQSRPIRIRVLPQIATHGPACLGTYDRSCDEIAVTAPDRLAGAGGDGGPYDVLPPGVLFRALVAHEMAHALLEQTGAGRRIAPVDHEYVAAVFELRALDPDWRAAYVAAAPVSLPPKAGLVNAAIHALAPRQFAVNAWQLFASEPDGCARIREIAEGTFTFAVPLPP